MTSRSSTQKLAPPAPDGGSVSALAGIEPTGNSSAVPAPPVSSDEATVISRQRPDGQWLDAGRLTPAEIGQMLAGQRLGQFVLQQFIGGGGMGAVFRALDTTLNRDVAVKVLSRDQGSDEETLRRFRNEAQSAARLDHDNIARVHYVGEDRGVHYIVFEYIEGTNLRDLVERGGPLTLADAVSFTLQIAEALSHASQRDVIHRDIKPSNVLITPEGKAKLVDMGLARLHQVEQSTDDLTASGVTLGTFDYISPEQARDPRSADVRSDLYSLGCSLYYMLTGRPPFAQGTALQKLLQHQGAEPDDPRQLRPDLPVELVRVLQRLLAKNPAKRYQHPDELIVELAAWGEQHGLHVASASRLARPAPPAWRRHLPWAVPLVLLIAVVLVLDAYWSRAESAAPWGERRASSKTATATPSGKSLAADGSDRRAVKNGAVADRSTSNGTAGSTGVAAARSSANGDAAAGLPPGAQAAVAAWVDRWSHGDSPLLDVQGGAARAATAIAELLRSLPRPSELPADRGGSSASSAAAPSAEIPDRDRVLIVSSMDAGPLAYTSLQAACAAAQSGDTIELAFDGPRDERPVQLANLHLTIRAAKGYRPVLRFRPDHADAVRYPRSVLTISGGQVALVDLAIDWQLPAELRADGWALFELRRTDLLRLERVALTIRNSFVGRQARSPDVAVLELRAAPGGGAMTMIDPVRPDVHRTAIELGDCVVRGEAVLLKSNEQQSARLGWTNGLFATSESLVSVVGAATSVPSAPALECDLRHLTLVAGGGLLSMANTEEAPFLSQVSLRLADSLVVVGAAAALVDQRGIDSPAAWRQRLAWNADRVHYAGSDEFWRTANIFAPGESSRWSFAEWRTYWGAARETNTRAAGIAFENPPVLTVPYHAHRPQDYRLAADALQPARRAASDGVDLGLRLERLPPVPDPLAADGDSLE